MLSEILYVKEILIIGMYVFIFRVERKDKQKDGGKNKMTKGNWKREGDNSHMVR